MARLQDFPTVTPTSSDKLLVVQSQSQGLVPYGSKLDSANPTGTGSLSLNRKSGTSTGSYSVAECRNCEASGDYSHAEGYQTKASNTCCHAEGTTTQATGLYSHAEGNQAIASGQGSHADGSYTIANHRSQHVFGELNAEDTSTAAATARGNFVEIVGNGTGTNARSNARTLDWSGNEVLAGGLKVNGSDDVQPMVELEQLNASVTKTYTIPSSIFDDYGIYILAFGSNYGVGAVYILMVAGSSGGDKLKITPLVTSTYLSISAVAKNQFSATSGVATFRPRLTRIA